MRFSVTAALAAAVTAVADPLPTAHAPACTATSSSGSGAFFDLRPDMAVHPDKGTSHKAGVTKDYHSKGYDYGKNFTMNICGSVVDPVSNVVGLDKNAWANVSAYYMSHGNIYSIGSVMHARGGWVFMRADDRDRSRSLDLHSRGRKLVLQYTAGSPCGSKSSKEGRTAGSSYTYDDGGSAPVPQPHQVETLGRDDDDKTTVRRKSTTISFLCDQNPGGAQASVSFVGTDPDECAYFFEARSVHACAHAEPHKPGSVGPGSVFGIILVIAVLVYALGGVFYNRTVAHARGWRQLPNYSIWAGIWSFVSDVGAMVCSSCAHCLPGSRGYSHLDPNASARNRNSEAENRLIDQLDEEWDD
ncbi:Mannose-6-phosphate receptor, binding protein [Tolypocladium capitatum]|uniref:Mannose-6-phosphate receptor, binding protein n=1 Tax=Tolypocladium capitatum TaxID=45235 RepID=A0A2K3QDK8_9HYPO|nr:Mannose-6-phosphate receptor, binding protein [Tolypocladium capitatum]